MEHRAELLTPRQWRRLLDDGVHVVVPGSGIIPRMNPGVKVLVASWDFEPQGPVACYKVWRGTEDAVYFRARMGSILPFANEVAQITALWRTRRHLGLSPWPS